MSTVVEHTPEAENTGPKELAKGRFESFLDSELLDAFHDRHGNAYLTVDIEGVPTTFEVDSQECADFLQLKHYRLTGKGMPRAKLESVLPTLTARACNVSGDHSKSGLA